MLTVAIGHSADIDLDRAIAEVIDQAKKGLTDAEASAGLLFVANHLDHSAVLAGVRAAFPGVSLVGCTTAGEASSVLGFQDDSILLVLFASPDVRFAAAIGRTPLGGS